MKSLTKTKNLLAKSNLLGAHALICANRQHLLNSVKVELNAYNEIMRSQVLHQQHIILLDSISVSDLRNYPAKSIWMKIVNRCKTLSIPVPKFLFVKAYIGRSQLLNSIKHELEAYNYRLTETQNELKTHLNPNYL